MSTNKYTLGSAVLEIATINFDLIQTEFYFYTETLEWKALTELSIKCNRLMEWVRGFAPQCMSF